MALLVHDNGELQSLRYLVNSNNIVPRNLILKLYSSSHNTNGTPLEGDIPSQTAYYEPYDASGLVGYGSTPITGYPSVINNRNDQNYTNQYGILLDGSRWNVRTITTPIKTTTGSGTINEYTITVTSVTNISVGHYVSGGGVGANATVCAINGNTLVLSVANASTFASQTLNFGVGTTTASYPEQTFTFSDAANNQVGYYLVRANNMPLSVAGVLNAATVSANTGVAKTGTNGVIGQNFITLYEETKTPTVSGSINLFTVEVDTSVGIATGQRVIGVGIASNTRVVGVQTGSPNDIVILDKKNTGTVAGVGTFFLNVTENITVGMGVTHGFLVGQTNGVPSATTVTGIDEKNRVVYLSNSLLNNIQSATGDTFNFNSSKVTIANHGLVPGDVIYIAPGAANTTTVSSTYTIFETPNTSTFTTTPALAVGAGGTATLYSSIMFAEKFTNGPYNIQNNGDQIKVTLNISLD
jgi:hypothetical protein